MNQKYLYSLEIELEAQNVVVFYWKYFYKCVSDEKEMFYTESTFFWISKLYLRSSFQLRLSPMIKQIA